MYLIELVLELKACKVVEYTKVIDMFFGIKLLNIRPTTSNFFYSCLGICVI